MKTYKIQNLVDEALQEKQDERKDKPRSGKISPSSLGRCFRAQLFNRLNIPQSNPPNARTLRLFKAGDLFHDFVQGLVKSNEAEIEKEVDYKDIHGFADYVDKDCVLDFKSQRSDAFWHQKKKEYNIKEDKLSNWLQVACYANILNKPYCGLVFISKDDVCISEYIFEAKEFNKPLAVEFKTLRSLWDKKELPEGSPRAYGGKECKYCFHRDTCKKKIGIDKKVKFEEIK